MADQSIGGLAYSVALKSLPVPLSVKIVLGGIVEHFIRVTAAVYKGEVVLSAVCHSTDIFAALAVENNTAWNASEVCDFIAVLTVKLLFRLVVPVEHYNVLMTVVTHDYHKTPILDAVFLAVGVVVLHIYQSFRFEMCFSFQAYSV